jgi:hypothetical protein
MIEFEFKWTNQQLTPHYRPPALAVDGNIRPDSNVNATTRVHWAKTLTSTLSSTSIGASGST